MKITQLYIYPIKSLRALPVPSAQVTGTGFQHDRRFMLLRVIPSPAPKPTFTTLSTTSAGTSLENMHVSQFPQMTRFTTALRLGKEGAQTYLLHGEIVVTFHPVGEEGQGETQTRTLEVPVRPDVKRLKLDHVNVVMHGSPTKAYDMGEVYNRWFSECFGFDVVLAYLGPHTRSPLGNVNPYPKVGSEETLYTKAAKTIWSYVPSLSWKSSQDIYEEEETEDQEHITPNLGGITFADCASYLIVTEESLADASSRLPDGETMDITKFRPNIVLSGAPTAYDEDFWGSLSISSPPLPESESDSDSGVDMHSPSSTQKSQTINIALTANCTRCQSLNIDYTTGAPGTGESGKILKKLMKDRRVDAGVKYSPVFGRYGFVVGDGAVGKVIRVGDGVGVGKRNEERTAFEWPGLTS